MSSPSHGRALAFPLVWKTDRHPVAAPGTIKIQVPSDEELMARLQDGAADALNSLFDRYSGLVFTIAHRILNDHGESEEIVQEAFFYVYRKATLFDANKGLARVWIVQIAFNRALDRKALLARRVFYAGTNIDSMEDTLLGKADTEREVGARLNRAHLERAFGELTEEQRQTLEMFYFQGLELKEISAELHESLGNVRHHFYRGLERLRRSAFVQRLREK
jgi:RNA polymerase sigma-70 factor (ECF subfamily)